MALGEVFDSDLVILDFVFAEDEGEFGAEVVGEFELFVERDFFEGVFDAVASLAHLGDVGEG